MVETVGMQKIKWRWWWWNGLKVFGMFYEHAYILVGLFFRPAAAVER